MQNDLEVTVDWTKTTEKEQIEALLSRYFLLSDIVSTLMIDKAKEAGVKID